MGQKTHNEIMRYYLNEGGRYTKLPSGDQAVYIDLDIDHLNSFLNKPDVIREMRGKRVVRIFVIPRQNDNPMYKCYLEIAPKKQ